MVMTMANSLCMENHKNMVLNVVFYYKLVWHIFVHSGSKFMAVCVLNIDLLVLLLQKPSLSNIVFNFNCYNNINTTTCIAH